MQPELTDNNIRLGGGFLDDGRVSEAAVDELGLGIGLLDGLSALLAADKEGKLPVRMRPGQEGMGSASDVSWKWSVCGRQKAAVDHLLCSYRWRQSCETRVVSLDYPTFIDRDSTYKNTLGAMMKVYIVFLVGEG